VLLVATEGLNWLVSVPQLNESTLVPEMF